MKPKLLFIHHSANKWRKKLLRKNLSMPPYGLLQIASYLKEYGYQDIHIIDFMVENFTKEFFVKRLKELKPSIAGISTYTENYNYILLLSKIIKKLFPETKIVLGGPHVTFMPEKALQNPSIDYVIMHEGEITLLELLNHLYSSQNINLKNIKGLAFKKNGKIYINPKRNFITDLDELPFINRDLVDLKKYATPFTIVSSRGCSGNCIFCSSRAMSGNRYRMRSAENIFWELEYLLSKYGKRVKRFYIADDTFTADKKRVYKFCKLIKNSNLNILWNCESRIDVMDEKLLETMHSTGCYHIQLGVESGVQKVIDSIGKKISLEKLESILKLAKNIGIQITCSFIIGLPQDTIKTMRNTIEYMLYLAKEYSVRETLAFNTPFPGTPEHKNAKKLGLNIHTLKWKDYDLNTPIVSTKEFSREDLIVLYCEWVDKYTKVCKDIEKKKILHTRSSGEVGCF